MTQPNIILIMADQMRGDCLSYHGNRVDVSQYGHPVVETPNLDHLAARGAYYPHAYSAVPSCLPARATLMTGMDQWHTGVLGMGRGQGPIPNDFPHTLAGTLRDAGYRTHLVGKGHFTPQRTSMGFQSAELDESGRLIGDGLQDEYRAWFDREKRRDITPDDHGVFWNSWMARPWHTEEYLHPTAWTMSRSLHFLEQRAKQRDKHLGQTQPFFLNISFARPHSPYVPPQPYFDMYINQETPAPFIGDWAGMNDCPDDALDVNAWRGKLSPQRIHRGRAGYYGEITFIDTQIGRLINWLTRHQPDTLRNTWIVFTSDHGDMVGDHHLWRKTYAYEGSARVPMIVAPPVGQETQITDNIVDNVVELRDVMPTLLDIAGVERPPTVMGESLLKLCTEQHETQPTWRRYLHGEHCWCYGREQEMQFVTDGHRKFVWLPRIDVKQFFDLDADPGETRNLVDAPNYADEVAMWQGFLAEALAVRDCGWVRDGQLVCEDDGPLVSPYRNVRFMGNV
ncbi:MAG: arylsulfatase [Chloroflexota bacterium]